MDRMTVLEAMYETVKESLDWAFECRDDDYSYYMDGVVDVTEKMLEKIEERHRELIETMKSTGFMSVEV